MKGRTPPASAADVPRRRPHPPLTPPAVRPPTISFWMKSVGISTGAAGSVFDLLEDPRHNHRVVVERGVLASEAGTMLTNYFRRKRGKPPVGEG